MTSSSGAPPGMDSSFPNLLNAGLALAKEAMAGAPPWLKGFELFGVLAVAGILYVAVVYVAAGQYFWAIVAVLLAVVLTAGEMALLLGVAQDRLPAPDWRRSVPERPLDPEIMNQLGLLLGQIRHRAFQYLSSVNPTLQDRQVRANVFLANYANAGQGVPCILEMPNDLQINMNHPPEKDITFEPGSGATGQAFAIGRRIVTHRLIGGPHEWEDKYKMTDVQKAMVHKDLKWIVSFPVMGNSAKPIAVLNLDGLDCDFSVDHLGIMAANFIGDIKAFGIELEKQPQVSLTIRVERKTP